MSATARLRDLALSESGFVFDPYSGGTFTVNRTGMVLLHALRDGLSRPAIVERLRTDFQVDGADLESDIGEFVRLLVQQGLLPAEFALDAPSSAPPQSPAPDQAVHVSLPSGCSGIAPGLAADLPAAASADTAPSAAPRVRANPRERAS